MGFRRKLYLILLADPSGTATDIGLVGLGMRIKDNFWVTVHTRKLVFLFGNVFFVTQ